MKTSELRNVIRKEMKKSLNEGIFGSSVYMEKEKLIGIKFTRFEGASNIVYTIEDYKGKEPDTIMVTWTDRRNRPHYRAVPYQVKHVNELIGKGKWKIINR
jgi:hypothetical protein